MAIIFVSIFFGIFLFYLIISFLILPFQYRFLVALKKEEQKNKLKGKRQGEMYEKMNVSELVLHENIQGNPLFFLANTMASIIYRVKCLKKIKIKDKKG